MFKVFKNLVRRTESKKFNVFPLCDGYNQVISCKIKKMEKCFMVLSMQRKLFIYQNEDVF